MSARPAKQVGQAAPALEVEHFLLARLAQVGVDQQGLLAELGKHHRQVGREHRHAVARIDPDHGQRAPPAREPAQHQLAAHGAQLLDLRAERLEGRDQVRRQVRSRP
jgi:hypothetical protein